MIELQAEFSISDDLTAELTDEFQLNAQVGDAIMAGVSSFNGETGDVTYTAPVTSVNGETGDVTVSSPTKTSELQNDSGFITSADVPTKTTARADGKYLYNGQTVDAGLSGMGVSNTTNLLNNGYYVAVRANSSNPFLGLQQGTAKWYAQAANGYFYFGPTSANALRLDQSGNGVFQTGSVTAKSIIKSGGTSSQFLKADGSVDSNTYLTSAPVTSVNGQTGDVALTEGLTPLVGMTSDITPTQVVAAMHDGRTIVLTYFDSTFGYLTFNYFIFSAGMNLVFASTMIEVDMPGISGVFSATITGYLTSDTWNMTVTQMQKHISLVGSMTNIPHSINVGYASTWAFAYDSSAEEIAISGANGQAPSLGPDISVYTELALQED